MPRNVTGLYSLAPGNPVTAGTTILSSWANATLTDLANAMTDSLSRSGSGGMTAPLVGVVGAAAAPSFSFAGDLGTGVYRPAAGVFGISTGGTGRFAVGAAGSVHLGGVAPAASISLYVNRNLVGPTVGFGVLHDSIIQSDVTGTANLFMTQARTAAAGFTLSQLNHFRVNQASIGAGSVLAEQNGFIADSTLIGATVNIGFRGVLPTGVNRWNCYMDGSAPNYFAGEVRVGTVTQLFGGHLSVLSPSAANSAVFYITGDNTATRNVCWFGTTANGVSGAITLNGLTIALANVSDYRRKKDVSDLLGAEDRIQLLRPIEFDWTDQNLPRQRGFIAHEFGKVYPTAVSGEKDAVNEDGTPMYQMISDAAVIPDLVSAVKNLLSRVAQLEAA